MRFCRSIWTDVCGNDDISFQNIPFFLHIKQLCRHGQNCAGAIPVGDETCHDRPGSQASKPAYNTKGRCCFTGSFPAFSGNQNAYYIRAAIRSGERKDLYICRRIDREKIVFHTNSACCAVVKNIENFEKLFHYH